MKPVVFLDVDGVINDLSAIFGGPVAKKFDHFVIEANGFTLHIPEFMPKLIQSIVAECDVYWLTTWREDANKEIAMTLGIDPLPVITDGGDERSVRWKSAAAYPVAEAALADGREVWWIEDFYGEMPLSNMPDGVNYVDTARVAKNPVLLPAMVPTHLKSEPIEEPLGRFGEPIPPRRQVFTGEQPD